MPRWFDELAAWWAALPPEAAFMLCVPFAVAAAGLIAHAARERRR